MNEGKLYYTLEDLSLTEASLAGADTAAKLKILFDAITYYKDVQIHVSTTGNLSSMCPESRGTFIFRKVDDAVAMLQFVSRSTGRIYSGTYVDSPSAFYGWFKPIDIADEALDDSLLESKVTALEEAIGDIALVDHYGGTIVEILNKYTRQVLTDSSEVANQILLKDYYGNIQDISYDTPLIVQANNSSIAWDPEEDDAPSITFQKDITEWNPVTEEWDIIETIEETYLIKVLDLAGGPTDYVELTANNMTKNVFYTFIKRQVEVTPGNMLEIFVLLLASDAAEYASVTNRLFDLESVYDEDKTVFNITNIIATAAVNCATLVTSGTATIGTNGLVEGSFNVKGNTVLEGTLNVSSVTTVGTLAIGTSINLADCAVQIKAIPGAADLVNKSYVDTKAATEAAAINNKFAAGAGAPSGNNSVPSGCIYWFQIS